MGVEKMALNAINKGMMKTEGKNIFSRNKGFCRINEYQNG